MKHECKIQLEKVENIPGIDFVDTSCYGQKKITTRGVNGTPHI